MSSIDCDRMVVLAALASLASALALSCAGSATGDAAPPRTPVPAEPGAGGEGAGGGADGMTVQSSKGYLDPNQINAAVAPHQAALVACFQDRLKERSFLSGDMRIQFLVQKSGQVGTVEVVESSVGDWSVEHCVLEVARHIMFARPVGGDGTAGFSLPVQFASDQAGAVERWTETQVAPVVTQHAAELDACTGAAGGAAAAELTVTLYVGNRGEVKAAGFSSPVEIADTWADCAAKVIASWTFPDPMGKIVKAAFHYPPVAR